MHLFNPAKLSEQLFIPLCALPEGYKQWIIKHSVFPRLFLSQHIFVRKIHVKPIFDLQNLKLNYDTCTSAMTVVGNHQKFSGCTLRVKIILIWYKTPFQNFTDAGMTSHTIHNGIQIKIFHSIKQNINREH